MDFSHFSKSLLFSFFAFFLIPSLFAQRGGGSSGFSGKSWGAGFDFYFSPLKTTINRPGDSAKLDIPYAARGFKVKFGPLVATRNFIYVFLASQQGGLQTVELNGNLAAKDAINTSMSIEQTATQAGLGYTFFIGNVQMRSFNYFVGTEAGTMSYTNTFRQTDILLDEKTKGSSVIARLFGGMNFLLGSADFHLEIFYAYGPGQKNVPLSSRDGLKYTESSSFSGPGATLGINNYF